VICIATSPQNWIDNVLRNEIANKFNVSGLPQRIGVIDLGSNTTRLIVMAFQPHYAFKLVDEIKETVRLVEGASNNVLQPAPIGRAIKALQMFASFAHATDVPQVVGIATSAVRDAINQADVLHQITKETGLQFRVVSGEEEAFYGYLGVINSLSLQDGFLVDIGGGSAQVSLVRGRGLVRAVSMPVGAVRMTERFFRSDPPTKGEWKVLEDHLDSGLKQMSWFKLNSSMQLVGLGGTIRNLANIDQHLQGYPLNRLHAYQLHRERLELIVEELRRRSVKERLEIPGLNDERADVILAGAAVLRQLMRHSKADVMHISGEGLREGVFYERFLPGLQPPIIPHLRSFAIENLARVYNYDHLHVAKVQDLALQMFDQLQSLHGYGPWERELLAAAATLHDIGTGINYYDHHKHSAYIILNSTLPGYTHREVALIALVARYHRKGAVDVSDLRGVLGKNDEQRVARLSALLRIAEYLERSKTQVVSNLQCTIDGTVRIAAATVGDATVEIWDANRRVGFFRKAFGVDVVIE
jgi:exopolyphosphatase/guanosine-5'-triphosphate,3'-diphosphate pyrophosphatase